MSQKTGQCLFRGYSHARNIQTAESVGLSVLVVGRSAIKCEAKQELLLPLSAGGIYAVGERVIRA